MSNIIFNKLMNIKLRHDFYADGLCNDLIIEPSPSTKQLLKNYNILFKKGQSDVALLFEAIDDLSTPKVSIDKALTLTFFVHSSSKYFTNFTNITFGNQPLSSYYFNNKTPTIDGQDHIIHSGIIAAPLSLLTKDLKIQITSADVTYLILSDANNNEFRTDLKTDAEEITIELSSFKSGVYEVRQFNAGDAQVGDTLTFYYNTEISGSIPFAVIELFIDDTYDTSTPANFILNFESRPTYWRYKILKKEASNPIVVDDFNAETVSIRHLPDDENDMIEFNEATGTDPIVVRSTNQVKLKEKGFEKIGLYKNAAETPIISNLPNPSPTKLERAGDDWFSDIYVYVYV